MPDDYFGRNCQSLAEYLYVPHSFPFDVDQQPEPKLLWKARRLWDGSYERQRHPPIPVMTPQDFSLLARYLLREVKICTVPFYTFQIA